MEARVNTEGAKWWLAAALSCFAGCGGGGEPASEVPKELLVLSTVPAHGAVLAEPPASLMATFDGEVDAALLPAEALALVAETGERLEGTVELAPGDPRSLVLHLAPGASPLGAGLYELCVSADIEAVDGRMARPTCIEFRVADPLATNLAAGTVRTLSTASGYELTELVRTDAGGFALMHRHVVGGTEALQSAWLDEVGGAWTLGPDMADTGYQLVQLVVDGAGVLHGRGIGEVLSADRHGELARVLLPGGTLVRADGGAVDCWGEHVVDGGVATRRYDPALRDWRPVTAVDSYELDLDWRDHAAAPGGRLHHGRVEVGPLGTLRLVVDERARSGRVMRTAAIETGIAVDGPFDMNMLQLHAGDGGRALAVLQAWRYAASDVHVARRAALGVAAYDPALGWGAFELLAAGEGDYASGYWIDVRFAGPRAALFIPDAIGSELEIHVRDQEGRWTREQTSAPTLYNIGSQIGAIDAAGNLLCFSSLGSGVRLHGRKAGRHWSAACTFAELGVLGAEPRSEGRAALAALGAGRFLLVHGHRGAFSPSFQLDSCVVELR